MRRRSLNLDASSTAKSALAVFDWALGRYAGQDNLDDEGRGMHALSNVFIVAFAIVESNIVPPDIAALVCRAAETYNARLKLGLQELRHDEIGEQEVAEVVGPKLPLEAIGGLLVWSGHLQRRESTMMIGVPYERN